MLRPIEAAAVHWAMGDKALANLRLVFSGLPKLDHPADAARLQAAAFCLDHGMAPRALMTALDLDPSVLDVVKFDPDQPRVPAGNGEESGRWRTLWDGFKDWLDQPVPEYDTDTGTQVGTQSRGRALATNPATVGIAGTAALLGGEAAVGALVTDGVPIGTVLPDGTVAGANAAGAAPNLVRLGTKFGINADSEAGANILRNLNISVRQFISQYRSGRILREFPGEHLEGTVGEALQSGGLSCKKTAHGLKVCKMNTQQWYSAKLRFVILVEPTGGDTIYDCLFLLKAVDFPSAFDRALSIGKQREAEYKNKENQTVAWKFAEILSLDVISDGDLDGAELYSESCRSQQEIHLKQVFKPELSKPVQTI